MNRIVVPFSDAASGERAVAALLREPRAADLEVELVAMVDPIRPGKVAVFVTRERAQGQATDAAQDWLARLASRHARADVPHRTRVAVGSATRTLRELAQRGDIARIVIAVPEEAPWRNWWRHFALRTAASPVTVVP